jgi:hypothetical protein
MSADHLANRQSRVVITACWEASTTSLGPSHSAARFDARMLGLAGAPRKAAHVARPLRAWAGRAEAIRPAMRDAQGRGIGADSGPSRCRARSVVR